MNKSLKTLLIGAALAGGVAAGAVYAMPPGGGCMSGPQAMGAGRHGGMDSEMRIERMAAALDLSTEQRDKVRAIVDKARPATRATRDKLNDNREQLRALHLKGTAPEADVRKLAETQGKLVADMIVQRTKVQSEINAVLTPAQREQWQQRFQRRGPGFGRNGNGDDASDATGPGAGRGRMTPAAM